MYDQNFRNQAVKECVNGQSLKGTARKYRVSDTALKAWVNEYKQRIAVMSGPEEDVKIEAEEPSIVKDPIVELKSINVNIDGHDITMAKQDVVKLMEIFCQFDK